MNCKLSFSKPAEVETECLAAAVVDRGENNNPQPAILCSDAVVRHAAEALLMAGEVTGKIFEATMLHRPAGLKAKRLLLVGGGKAKNFTSIELRKLAGTAVRFLKPKAIRSFAFAAPDLDSGPADAVKSVIEGAFVANFDPDFYKTDRKDQLIDDITIITTGDRSSMQTAADEGRIITESQNLTRRLVNEPGNRLTPTLFGERARQMAAEVGLHCDVYGPDKIQELKMGAFWGVAKGSEEPPALIVLRYEPDGAPAEPVLGLVGKGITFDSGGISIKSADGMEKMKYDMAGGAAMLGAMRAIALLKPKMKVVCAVCATENMPSGKAQKPGDVQIAMSGKSIEVINTDAEGRMVLADGLFYARQLGATHLIDAATLTSACVIALGQVNFGVFANDDAVYEQFRAANRRAGEKMWRLPLDPEYQEQIRSTIADIMNTGGRYGGAITAAMFLKEFVDNTPWLHLDIAGTAWVDDNKAWIAKGPSGVAVRSIVEFAKDLAGGGATSYESGTTGGGHTARRTATQEAKERSDKGVGL